MAVKPSIKKCAEGQIRARNEGKILSAAVALFSRKGYDGTRISEIADACGLPKANVYYYFPTKEDIYTTLIERVLESWDAALEHIVADRDPRDALGAYLSAKIQYSRKHTADSRFFANEMLRGGRFLTQQQRDHMHEITRDRVAVLEGWIRDGLMAPVDPYHLFIMMWSTTQFYADFESIAALTLGKSTLTTADYKQAAQTIIATLLDGCLLDATPN